MAKHDSGEPKTPSLARTKAALEAYDADTADRNSWSQASVVDLATLRRWVAEGWS